MCEDIAKSELGALLKMKLDYEVVKSRSYLLKLTWPIFLELMLQMLVSNVDQMMVSRSSDTASAAIGNANVVTNLLLISFSVINMASTILISQYMGSGNKRDVAQTYTVSTAANVVFGMFVSLALFFCSPWMFTMMKLAPEIMPEACVYLQIIGGGMIFQAIYLTFSAFLRCNALTKESMFISVVINFVNIFVNLLLINGAFGVIPAMGVAGAAIASVISRVIGCVLIIYIFYKNVSERLSWQHLRPFPADRLKKLLRLGIPSGGESVSYNFSQLFIQTTCNLLPLYVITSRVYCNIFATLSYVFSMSIGQANQIVVGYLMGGRHLEDTHKRVMSTLKSACLISFIVSLAIYFASDFLFGFLTNDPEILAMCKTVMLLDIVLEQGRAGNIVLYRALQATGDIRLPILVGVGVVWTVAVGGSYLLGITLGWGLAGIWAAMIADECIRAIFAFFRWRHGDWRKTQVM